MKLKIHQSFCFQLTNAEKSIKKSSNKNDDQMQPMRRTWLKNVDYKNGGLISENRKLKKKTQEESNDDKTNKGKKDRKDKSHSKVNQKRDKFSNKKKKTNS